MLLFNIGDDANLVSDDTVPLAIQPGATVTVKNVAGGTINYYYNIDDGVTNPDGTITTGNSQNFTTPPVWIMGVGSTTVQITGTGY